MKKKQIQKYFYKMKRANNKNETKRRYLVVASISWIYQLFWIEHRGKDYMQ